MAAKELISIKREKALLHWLFFLFGFGIMAWVPRFPELKAQLHLGNGAFGSILSMGSVGALLGLLFVGQIVHKVGIKPVALTALVILYLSFAVAVHLQNSFFFLLCNVVIGAGITAFHICINTQAFNIQERTGNIAVTTGSGYWSFGALATAIFSGLLVGRVDLKTHIEVLSLLVFLLSCGIIVRMSPVLIKANQDNGNFKVREIFTKFHFDWPISLGMASAIYLEFAIGDWGTIFTKERFEIDAGLSTIPYIVFTAAMIFGRLSIHKLLPQAPINIWVKKAAILGGVGFGLSIAIATHLPERLKWVSYSLLLIGYLLGGLGSSFIAPSYFSAANRRSPHPSAVVVGQFGVLNNLIIFVIKWVVAWTIQFTGSIGLALAIPAVLLIATVFFTDALVKDKR